MLPFKYENKSQFVTVKDLTIYIKYDSANKKFWISAICDKEGFEWAWNPNNAAASTKLAKMEGYPVSGSGSVDVDKTKVVPVNYLNVRIYSVR